MRMALVVTSVGYGDILAFTLPTNRSQFHYTVVATTPEDTQTQKVCEYWNVHCIQVPEFHNGGGFRKGAGINSALRTLKQVGHGEGWVIHMDADIFLPPLAGEMLGRAALDPKFVYGIDRMMVRSFEDWTRFLNHPQVQQECRSYVHAKPFAMGTRIATPNPGYNGYVPIGFFQMWCPTQSGVDNYPEEHTSAGRGDMLFAAKWPRAQRAMIPEIIGYHLESEFGVMGVNWNGRKTKPFLPTSCDPAPVAPPAPYMHETEADELERILLAHCPTGRRSDVLEWGSGGSTVRFPHTLHTHGRDCHWLAVEHDHTWASRIKPWLDPDVSIEVRPPRGDFKDPESWQHYIECGHGEQFDVVLVDGRMRRRCLLVAGSRLRDRDSVIVLHDAERPYYHPGLEGYEGEFVTKRIWVGKPKHLPGPPQEPPAGDQYPAPCPDDPILDPEGLTFWIVFGAVLGLVIAFYALMLFP